MAHSVSTVSAAIKKATPFPPVAAKLLQLFTDAAVDCGQVAELVCRHATNLAKKRHELRWAAVALVTLRTGALTLLWRP